MIDAMMCAGQAFIREWKANFENELDKIIAGVEEFCEWIQTECFERIKVGLDHSECRPLPGNGCQRGH